jgi:hypothetical protein
MSRIAGDWRAGKRRADRRPECLKALVSRRVRFGPFRARASRRRALALRVAADRNEPRAVQIEHAHGDCARGSVHLTDKRSRIQFPVGSSSPAAPPASFTKDSPTLETLLGRLAAAARLRDAVAGARKCDARIRTISLYAGRRGCDVSDTPPAKVWRKSSNCGPRVSEALQIAAEGVVAIGIAASLFLVRHADRASRPRLKTEGESQGSPSTREHLMRSWDRAKSIGPCDGSAALFAERQPCVNTARAGA